MAIDFLALSPEHLRDRLLPTHLYFFEQLDSTNLFALNSARKGILQTPALVLARQQTQGRGQREARWESPPGNLAMTFCFKTQLTAEKTAPVLGRLGLDAAAAIWQAIQALHQISDGQIKWPNDLVISARKLGGLLIETVSDSVTTTICLGIGLNVNSSITASLAPNALPAVALSEILGKPVPLMALVSAIHDELKEVVTVFPEPRFGRAELEQRLWKFQNPVSVTQRSKSVVGYLAGITDRGELLIRNPEGELLIIASGTLRPEV